MNCSTKISAQGISQLKQHLFTVSSDHIQFIACGYHWIKKEKEKKRTPHPTFEFALISV